MREVTLKQLKPILKSLNIRGDFRPILNNVLVTSDSLSIHDLETCITIKDTYGLKEGLHTLETIDLLKENNGIDIKEYPLLPKQDATDFKVILNINDLERFLKFVSKDQTRLHLNGVGISDGHIVATNGHILKFKEIEYDSNAQDIIIPTKSIKTLVRLMKKYKLENAYCEIDDIYLFIDNSQFRFTSRLISREYPRWQAVIPQKFEYQFNVTNWINYKELKPLFNPKTKRCTITVLDGMVNFKIDGHDTSYLIGSCEDTKLNLNINFNGEYLDLVCKNKANETIVLKGNNELSPILSNNNEIVMPMK